MTEDDHFRQRKRMRLPNYDYSQGGGYFLTIDVLNRRELFGIVENSAVNLSHLGQQIADAWRGLPDRQPGLILDEWILMPDHFHAIVILSSADPAIKLPNLIDVVQGFKSLTTRIYHRYKEEFGLMDLATTLWQRSYYERVIRSQSDLEEKRNYIRTNPQRWELKRLGLQ